MLASEKERERYQVANISSYSITAKAYTFTNIEKMVTHTQRYTIHAATTIIAIVMSVSLTSRANNSLLLNGGQKSTIMLARNLKYYTPSQPRRQRRTEGASEKERKGETVKKDNNFIPALRLVSIP